MSAELDSLIRMARWGREQGKRNVIADLAPLCEIADELDRLRAELAVAKAEPIRPVLTWTATPPTEPGCYWTRSYEPDESVLVTVRREANGEIWAECCDLSDVVEWWGPVPRPP